MQDIGHLVQFGSFEHLDLLLICPRQVEGVELCDLLSGPRWEGRAALCRGEDCDPESGRPEIGSPRYTVPAEESESTKKETDKGK